MAQRRCSTIGISYLAITHSPFIFDNKLSKKAKMLNISKKKKDSVEKTSNDQ